MDTVLVVDDGAVNRELLRTLLEPDYTVLEAADGPTALRLVAEQDVDLVVLDVMMPGMTGYEVTRQLRAARGDDLLPILLLTSLSAAEERRQGFVAGADDFISKPVDAHELRLRVRAFLRTRRLFRERNALLVEAQQLHAIKDDFVALLVHDLRNPLAGLLAYLEMMGFETISASARETLEGATAAARRLHDLTGELLQARLLEEGALTATLESHDLGDVARAAVASVAGLSASQRVAVDVVPATPAFSVACDAPLLQRALENLLTNAIKHAPRDSRVTVRVTINGSCVMLEVEDEGKGISAEQRPLMFSKYGTLALRSAGRGRGHGLGLYFVGLVMQAHGGTVRVDEGALVGTRIVMSIPREVSA
ncbi:MAG: hybrid sensor histidine kinase/response regulator [Gemmatimonadaceae bacterium]